jgi:hypothetical protein
MEFNHGRLHTAFIRGLLYALILSILVSVGAPRIKYMDVVRIYYGVRSAAPQTAIRGARVRLSRSLRPRASVEMTFLSSSGPGAYLLLHIVTPTRTIDNDSRGYCNDSLNGTICISSSASLVVFLQAYTDARVQSPHTTSLSASPMQL